MLISQQAQGGSGGPKGICPASLSELRQRLREPSAISDGHRQRLLELARRLDRVQALGDEYCRVQLSPHVAQALQVEPVCV